MSGYAQFLSLEILQVKTPSVIVHVCLSARTYKHSFIWTILKEINFEWLGNHLKNIFVKGNQAGGLEKYLLLLLCSNKQNLFPLRNLKAWLSHILQASPKNHLPYDTLPPTLFNTVTLLQPPYAYFYLLFSNVLITSWQTTYFTIL